VGRGARLHGVRPPGGRRGRVPGDYGFVPGTSAADGDPLDALVLLDEPTYPGIRVPARVVGALLVRAGDSEPEPKLVCVAVGDPTFADAHRLEDLPGHLVAEIEQFFAVYQQLEDSRTEARRAARRRAGAAPPQPGRRLSDRTGRS